MPFLVHALANGMTVLGERMPGVRSAAMDLRVPAGGATDPVDRCGSATVLAEMVLRGAGDRDARQLTEHLDSLGLSRGSGASTLATRFTAAGLAANVVKGLDAYADVLRRPTLADESFGPSRDLAEQALEGLADNPQGLCNVRLKEWAWPGPFSRNPMGEPRHLAKLTAAAVRDDFADRYRPGGTVLSIAGDVDYDELIETAERLFGDWPTREPQAIDVTPPPGRFRHVEHDSEQTHIGLAYATVPEAADDYYLARLAVECLSGGMSGRLFHNIREERGLCYSIYASYAGLAGPELDAPLGSVFAYTGTSNDRAQATLDALLHELRDVRNGVTADELRRAKIGLKSGTVTSNESTSARASALSRDFATRGRPRPLDETLAALDAVTPDALNAWLADHPAGPFTVVLIGPKALDVAGNDR